VNGQSVFPEFCKPISGNHESGQYSAAPPKVVIQHKKNFHYVGAANDWTSNPSDAQDFRAVDHAAAFCREHGLKDVFIVLGRFNEAMNRFDASSKTMLQVPLVRWRAEAG
jgi:hypothetical protein